MKTLVNNRDKRIRITAPKIEFKPKYINGLCWDYDAYEIGREMTVYAKDWTLVEEKQKEQKPVENPKKGCPTYPLSAVGDLLAKMPPAPIRFEPEQKPVDLEKEIKKHTDLFHADIEYPLRLTAIKFYELGRKGGSK